MTNSQALESDESLNRKERRSLETRQRLLFAAEKLFAEEGVGAVSMRQINSAAEQKNNSSLHYHFGSREAIMEAILDYRMSTAGRRRTKLLSDLMAEGGEPNLRALVHVAIWPLAEQLLTENQPNYFVRYLAQLHRLPQFDAWLLVRHRNRESLVRVYLKLMRLIEGLPRPIVHTRAIIGLRNAIYMLADLDRLIVERHSSMRDEMVRFYARDLIDMLSVSLTAEMSPATKTAYFEMNSTDGNEPVMLFGLDALHAHNRARSQGAMAK